jgi:hypothetical protein
MESFIRYRGLLAQRVPPLPAFFPSAPDPVNTP